MAAFLEDLCDPYYVEVQGQYRNPACLRLGQVCWAPVAFTEEQHRFWRPANYDDTRTCASQFAIVNGAPDLYNRALPLQAPPLETTEEFLVVRSKRRPVVLLAFPRADVPLRYRHHILAAPCFSVLKKESDLPKIPPDQLLRIRSLEFPEVFFLPGCPPRLEKDNVLRLNLMQPIARGHLDPTPIELSPDVLQVLLGQLEHCLTGRYETPYSTAREMLLQENFPART